MFPPELQVKQFVSVVKAEKTQVRFQVFTTGDPRYYLFCPLDEHGCVSTFQFPVRKTDLTRKTRSMLARGCGNANYTEVDYAA